MLTSAGRDRNERKGSGDDEQNKITMAGARAIAPADGREAVWTKVRDAAGIMADARLHDLRHARASHALMNGESLHVAGRLLGHRCTSTTNRYVHLDDATLRVAAERVATEIRIKLSPTP